jgi:hypothetical protein
MTPMQWIKQMGAIEIKNVVRENDYNVFVNGE